MANTENFGFTAAQMKAAGISAAHLSAAASVLTRHGTGKHLALAMYLTPKGATQLTVNKLTGSPQVNVSRDLIAAGKAKPVAMPRTEGGHKVYRLSLTAGKAKAKPAKAKAKPAKATGKAKAAPATAPATE